jgi:hypothetical protein
MTETASCLEGRVQCESPVSQHEEQGVALPLIDDFEVIRRGPWSGEPSRPFGDDDLVVALEAG